MFSSFPLPSYSLSIVICLFLFPLFVSYSSFLCVSALRPSFFSIFISLIYTWRRSPWLERSPRRLGNFTLFIYIETRARLIHNSTKPYFFPIIPSYLAPHLYLNLFSISFLTWLLLPVIHLTSLAPPRSVFPLDISFVCSLYVISSIFYSLSVNLMFHASNNCPFFTFFTGFMKLCLVSSYVFFFFSFIFPPLFVQWKCVTVSCVCTIYSFCLRYKDLRASFVY